MRLLLVAALVGPAGALAAPGPAAAIPPYTLEERATAIALPSLVYLETVYTGYIRDKQTNQPVLASPVTYNRRCSGFVINADGHVATTRVCVSPPEETIRQQMLYVAGWVLIGEKKLDQAQLDAWVAGKLGATVVTGQAEGSKPDVQLFGQLNVATGATTGSPAIPGTVVKASDEAEGNVALVKLEQTNLPAAELLNDANFSTGTQLIALGFNTTDADERIGTYSPKWTSVQLVGDGKRGNATYYKTNEKLGTYFHGGMAIDTNGRVVGMVDEDPTLPNNANRAVYPASVVSALLGTAGVQNTLGDSDKTFRKGLDAYFNGKYRAAITDLDKVAQAVPSNQIAPVYKQHAVDRQRIEGEPSSTPGWLIPTVAGVGGALVVGLIALLVMLRGRARRRAAMQPFTYPPVSGAPISGSPISGSPISGSPVSPQPPSFVSGPGVPVTPSPYPPAQYPSTQYPPTYPPSPNPPDVYQPAPQPQPPVPQPTYQAEPVAPPQHPFYQPPQPPPPPQPQPPVEPQFYQPPAPSYQVWAAAPDVQPADTGAGVSEPETTQQVSVEPPTVPVPVGWQSHPGQHGPPGQQSADPVSPGDEDTDPSGRSSPWASPPPHGR